MQTVLQMKKLKHKACDLLRDGGSSTFHYSIVCLPRLTSTIIKKCCLTENVGDRMGGLVGNLSLTSAGC